MVARRFVVPVLVAAVMAACSSPPPPPPEPAGPTAEEIEAARQDSIRRAEEAAEAARRRAEEEARAAAERAHREAVAAARAVLQQMVFFDYDQAEIREDAAESLRAKVGILRASPQVQIRIAGHADERGSTEYNMALGNRRAEAVKAFLAGFGIDGSRFTVVTFGESQPRAQGSTEEAWAQNRRAEFTITAGADAINPAN
ncbi:MAG: OmpA family protein [Gemmatimonadota bacterium]|nr:OmpA family protein [Gemmatimonadota bacterium]MDH5759778.1 OmpA family protein [Gemmatimonadota bacterium]